MAIPSEVDNIRNAGAVSASDKFFTTDPSGIAFNDDAYIGEDSIEKLNIVVLVEEPRDITAAVNASSKTEVADIAIFYDDGSETRTFPIRDAIIEHRPKMCSASVRKTADGSSQFVTGYSVSYVSLGIPTHTMDVLKVIITDDFVEQEWATGGLFNIAKLQTHDGYSWMPVKIPSPFAGSVSDGNRSTTITSVPEMIKTHRSSIMCDVFVSMRLKRVTRTKIHNSDPWELAMTVTYA